MHRLAYEFELDQSERKSSQVKASGWPNETQVDRKSKTCVDLRVRLARALGIKSARRPCSLCGGKVSHARPTHSFKHAFTLLYRPRSRARPRLARGETKMGQRLAFPLDWSCCRICTYGAKRYCRLDHSAETGHICAETILHCHQLAVNHPRVDQSILSVDRSL